MIYRKFVNCAPSTAINFQCKIRHDIIISNARLGRFSHYYLHKYLKALDKVIYLMNYLI